MPWGPQDKDDDRPQDKDDRRDTYYISADGRLHTSRQDAVAANYNFEQVGGRAPCPDPDNFEYPDDDTSD